MSLAAIALPWLNDGCCHVQAMCGEFPFRVVPFDTQPWRNLPPAQLSAALIRSGVDYGGGSYGFDRHLYSDGSPQHSQGVLDTNNIPPACQLVALTAFGRVQNPDGSHSPSPVTLTCSLRYVEPTSGQTFTLPVQAPSGGITYLLDLSDPFMIVPNTPVTDQDLQDGTIPPDYGHNIDGYISNYSPTFDSFQSSSGGPAYYMDVEIAGCSSPYGLRGQRLSFIGSSVVVLGNHGLEMTVSLLAFDLAGSSQNGLLNPFVPVPLPSGISVNVAGVTLTTEAPTATIPSMSTIPVGPPSGPLALVWLNFSFR